MSVIDPLINGWDAVLAYLVYGPLWVSHLDLWLGAALLFAMAVLWLSVELYALWVGLPAFCIAAVLWVALFLWPISRPVASDNELALAQWLSVLAGPATLFIVVRASWQAWLAFMVFALVLLWPFVRFFGVPTLRAIGV